MLAVGEEKEEPSREQARVQLSLYLFWFRPGRFDTWVAVSLGALASVAGRGKEVAPFYWRTERSPRE